jgi:hypothetical protein
MTRTARTCQLAPDWEATTHQPDGIDRALPWFGSNLHPRGRSRAAQLQQILQTMDDMQTMNDMVKQESALHKVFKHVWSNGQNTDTCVVW